MYAERYIFCQCAIRNIILLEKSRGIHKTFKFLIYNVAFNDEKTGVNVKRNINAFLKNRFKSRLINPTKFEKLAKNGNIWSQNRRSNLPQLQPQHFLLRIERQIRTLDTRKLTTKIFIVKVPKSASSPTAQ